MGSITTSRHLPTRIQIFDTGFGNGGSILTAPPILLGLTVTNKGASTLYLQLFDAEAVPAGGTVPTFVPIAVPAGTTVAISFTDVSGNGLLGLQCSAGLSWASSTTAGTLTQDSTSSLWVQARFAD
jgi:hypothetical protein